MRRGREERERVAFVIHVGPLPSPSPLLAIIAEGEGCCELAIGHLRREVGGDSREFAIFAMHQ